jgi:hypothetical protein
MEQYILKSALVAEIERRRDAALMRQQNLESIGQESVINEMVANELNKIISHLNTLEVKEVDLEKLINDYFTGWYFDNELDILAKPNNYSATVDDVKEIAKHFFELGLFSQLTWKDIKRISEIGEDFMNSEDSDNLNDEEYYTEILNKFKAQKGEEV